MRESLPTPEERFEIIDLFADYAWALDTADPALLADIVTDDAVIVERPPFVSRGKQEILAFFTRSFFTDDHFGGRIHAVSDMKFLPDREGRADHWYVETYWSAATWRVRRPENYGMGYYQDVVAKEAGRWKFRQRFIKLWEGAEVLGRFPGYESTAP
jgi:uncharacterized protein (TIGR02246 family)